MEIITKTKLWPSIFVYERILILFSLIFMRCLFPSYNPCNYSWRNELIFWLLTNDFYCQLVLINFPFHLVRTKVNTTNWILYCFKSMNQKGPRTNIPPARSQARWVTRRWKSNENVKKGAQVIFSFPKANNSD